MKIFFSKNTVYAGLLILRKTETTYEVVEDWLDLCEEHLPKIDLGCERGEISTFVGQDTDNGFLPLALAKHKQFLVFPGTGINLYDCHGVQLRHALTDDAYRKVDWSQLSDSPFSYRRDR
jgi:hypothetical protein